MDACPGRLNQVSLNIPRLGVYYGQCSELCGINHAFMPIVIETGLPSDFLLSQVENVTPVLETQPIAKIHPWLAELLARRGQPQLDV